MRIVLMCKSHVGLITLGSIFYIRSIYKHLYKFKKHLWVFENYKMKKLHKLYAKYSVHMEKFYKEIME